MLPLSGTLKPVMVMMMVKVLFCSQYEEPLIQAQGAHTYNYLFRVEIAACFFLLVRISIHVLAQFTIRSRRRRMMEEENEKPIPM